MKSEAGQYSKFGFCNYTTMCKRKHFTEEWNEEEKTLDQRDTQKVQEIGKLGNGKLYVR